MQQQGRHQEAEAYFRRAVEIDERLVADYPDLHENKISLANDLERWSDALSSMGRYKEAEAAYRRSVLVVERMAADSPTRLARDHFIGSLYGLADHLATWGRAVEKEEIQRRALRLSEELLADHPNEPQSSYGAGALCISLGNTCSATGRLEEAERLFRRGIDLIERALTAAPEARKSATMGLAIGLGNLGNLLRKTSRFQEAEYAYRRNFAVGEGVLRDDPTTRNQGWMIAEHRMDFADMLHRAGRRSEVEPAFRQGEALFQRAIAETPNLAEARLRLATHLADFPETRLRNIARATALAEEATRLTPRVPDPWASLGLVRYRAGDWKGTITAMEKTLELSPGGDGQAWFFLAMARQQLGEKDRAREEFDRAVRWMKTNRSSDEDMLMFRAEAVALLGVPELPADVFAGP
jgi:tetratricopeptide (TPR) repeat protein